MEELREADEMQHEGFDSMFQPKCASSKETTCHMGTVKRRKRDSDGNLLAPPTAI
jgi:hypothetical protein